MAEIDEAWVNCHDFAATPHEARAELVLGHSKVESAVRNLGIGVGDAIEIAENIDV